MATALGLPAAPVTARDLVSRRNIYILSAVLIGLFIFGSVSDLAISQVLYDPDSMFGQVLAAYGEVPTFLAWSASGTLFIVGRNPHHTVLRVGQVVFGGGLIAGSVLALTVMPTSYVALPLPVTGVLAVAIVGGTVFTVLKVSGDAEQAFLIRVGVVLFLVPAIQVVVVTALKIFWERPRMRMITVTESAGFMPWWQPGYPARSALMAQGVLADEFKSFPSGHTSNATTLLLLTSLSALSTRLRDKAGLFFWVGAAWGFAVAFSRIIMGAHFLTDTIAGFTVTFVAVLIVYQVAFPDNEMPKHARP